MLYIAVTSQYPGINLKVHQKVCGKLNEEMFISLQQILKTVSSFFIVPIIQELLEEHS